MDIAKVIAGCIAALALCALIRIALKIRSVLREERAELTKQGRELGIQPKRGESNADLRWRIRMAAIYAERKHARDRLEFLANGAQKPAPHPFGLQ